jgi:hypothetical protein
LRSNDYEYEQGGYPNITIKHERENSALGVSKHSTWGVPSSSPNLLPTIEDALIPTSPLLIPANESDYITNMQVQFRSTTCARLTETVSHGQVRPPTKPPMIRRLPLARPYRNNVPAACPLSVWLLEVVLGLVVT